MEDEFAQNRRKSDLYEEIGKLLRKIGQYRYFEEAITSLLEDFSRDMGIAALSEQCRHVNEALWLGG